MKLLAIFDYFFILRPMLHLPVWTIIILGYHSYSFSNGNKWHLPAVMAIGTILFGAVFLLNQIYDIESDRINNKLHFLPRGMIKIGVAWGMTIALIFVAIIGACILSPVIGIIAYLIVILGALYSIPPIALKNRPVAAAFANALGHGTLVFMLGFCATGGEYVKGLLESLPYFWAVGAVYIGTTLPDIEGDAQSGKRTLGIVLGTNKAIGLVILCYMISLVFGFALNDKPFLIAALTALPFYLYLTIKRNTASTVLAIKISIFTLTLAAGYMMPLYIVFVIILIILTRLYYKARFNMVYPSIK